MKYWVFDEEKLRFKQVSEQKLKFDYPYTPEGSIFYVERKNRTTGQVLKWSYIPFGKTKQECWDQATKYARQRIEKLEDELQQLKKEFKDKYGDRE